MAAPNPTSWDSVARRTARRRARLCGAAEQGEPAKTRPCSSPRAILTWWRTTGGSFPAWALAARIVFASSPNSASCERVFALLRNLFGELQMRSLADYVQAALMLNYNQRNVG